MNTKDCSVIEYGGCLYFLQELLRNFKYLHRARNPRVRADKSFQPHPFASSVIHLGCEPPILHT